MGNSCMNVEDLSSTMKEVTGAAVASLENVDGMDSANLGAVSYTHLRANET